MRQRLKAKEEQIASAVNNFTAQVEDDKKRKEEKLGAQFSLSSEFDNWAFTGSDCKKFKDVRALLGTIQDVIWVDSGWDAISMGELMINQSAVKKAWRKAIVLCHPDRHQTTSAEQQYRADRIFSAVNEAYKAHTGAAGPI